MGYTIIEANSQNGGIGTLNDTLIIVLGLIIMEVIVVFCVMYDRKRKYEAELESARIMSETDRLKFYSEFDFDKVDKRLSVFINDSGAKYRMNNYEYKDPEEVYLTEQDMTDMIKFMVNEVYNKITPALLDLIKLSYKIDTQESLIQILYDKCRDYVLNYSLEVNADIE